MLYGDIMMVLKMFAEKVDVNSTIIEKILPAYNGIVIRTSSGESWKYFYKTGELNKLPASWREQVGA